MADNIFAKSPTEIATDRADARTRGIFEAMETSAPSAPATFDFDTISRQTQVPQNIIEAAYELAGSEGVDADSFTSGFSWAVGQQIEAGTPVKEAVRAVFKDNAQFADTLLERAVQLAQPQESEAGVPPQQDSDGGGVLGDLARRGGASILSGLGSAVEGMGRALDRTGGSKFEVKMGADGEPELISTGEPSDMVVNTRDAGDVLREKGEGIEDGISADAQAAMQKSQFKGDLFKPSTWELPEDASFEGMAHLTVEVLGSMAPVVIASIATRKPVVGAGVGGSQSAGAGAEEARELIEEAAQDVDSEGVSRLERESPYYRELVTQGKTAEEALKITGEAAQRAAAGWAAIPGALGGAATGRILQKPLASLATRNAAVRVGGTAAVSAAEESAQEVAESVAGRAGVQQATGLDLDLTEGTLNDAVLGAMGGGPVGALGGIRRDQSAADAAALSGALDAAEPGEASVLPVRDEATTMYVDETGAPTAAPERIVPAPEAPPQGPLSRAAQRAPEQPEAPAPLATPGMVPGSKVRLNVPGGKPIDAVFKEENETGMLFEQDGNPFLVSREEIEGGKVAVEQVNPITEAQAEAVAPVEEFDPETSEILNAAAPVAQPVPQPAQQPRPKKPAKPSLQKRPFTAALKANTGGIDPAGPLGQDLQHRGVTPQTAPGLFRKGGAQSLDNLPTAEWAEYASLVGDDGSGYLSEQGIVDALADELAGKPVQGREQMELQAVADAKAELQELREMGVDLDETGAETITPEQAEAYRIFPPRNDVDDFTMGEDRADMIWRDVRAAELEIGVELSATERRTVFEKLNENGGSVEDALWSQLEKEPDEYAEPSQPAVQDPGPPFTESELSAASEPAGTGAEQSGSERSEGDAGSESESEPRPDDAESTRSEAQPEAERVDPAPELQDSWWRSLPKARHSAKRLGMSKDDLGDAWSKKAALVSAVNAELQKRGHNDLSAPDDATTDPIEEKFAANREAAKNFKKGDRVEYTNNHFEPPRVFKGTVVKVLSKQQGTIELRTDGGRGGNGYDVSIGASALRHEAPATEQTPEGEQTLIPGVEPVKDKDRAEAQMAKPKRGDDAAMPEGGLFDEGARSQTDLFDGTFETENSVEPAEIKPKQPDNSADKAEIDAAAAEADPNPTPAQAEAGNYKKGRFKWNGLDMVIETAKGEERRGTAKDGTEWSVTMPAHYGDIKRTEGADGDPVDFYMGEFPDSDQVLIVDQIDPETGKFDEHKVVLGVNNREDAHAIYVAGFSDGSGASRIGAITEHSIDSFKAWLGEGDTKNPADATLADALAVADQEPVKNTDSDNFAAIPEEKAENPNSEAVELDTDGKIDVLDQETEQGPASVSDLDYERGYAAYRNMTFTPEKRAKSDIEGYVSAVNGLYSELAVLAKTKDQESILDAEFTTYKERYIRHVNAMWDASSRTASPMITGPANFPATSNRKRLDTYDRRSREFLDWVGKAKASIKKKILEARPDDVKAEEAWKKIEAQVVQIAVDAKLAADGEATFNLSLLKGNFYNRMNTLANGGDVDLTLRMLKRLETVHEDVGLARPVFTNRHKIWKLGEVSQVAQAKIDGLRSENDELISQFEGASVTNAKSDERIRIEFDERVSSDVATDLKKEGWRWSRANTAWQRKNTSAAIHSARRIVGRHFDELSAPGSHLEGEKHKRSAGAIPRSELVDLKDLLNEELERLGLKGRATVRAWKQLSAGPIALDGLYNHGEINVSMTAADGPIGTFRHEVIHLLRDNRFWGSEYGLFTKDEWRALVREARKRTDLVAQIEADYPELSIAEQMEEIIAEMYRLWGEQRDATSPLAEVFQKISKALKAFANALRGGGHKDAASIFERIESGDIGGRAPGPRGPNGGRLRFSVSKSTRDKIEGIWNGDRTDAPTVLGKLPPVLRSLTGKNTPMVIASSVIRKAGSHRLTLDDVINAIEGLENPVMVFDARNAPGNFTVLVDKPASDGRSMVLGIDVAFKAGRLEISRIATIHGKDSDKGTIGLIRDGYLRYINKRKAAEWSRSRGLQLPKDGTTTPQRGQKILQHRDVFKADGTAKHKRTRQNPGFEAAPPIKATSIAKGAKQLVSDALTQAMAGKNGTNLLALVPGRALMQELGGKMPSVKKYLRLKEQMDTLRNERHAMTDELAQRWCKLLSGDKDANTHLMDLMHDSTIEGQDPSKPFMPVAEERDPYIVTKYGPNSKTGREAQNRLDKDAERKPAYDELRVRYMKLPEGFRDMYVDVRDAYDDLANEFESAIEANAEKAMTVAVRRAERAHERRLEEIRDDGLTGKEKEAAIKEADEILTTAKMQNRWAKNARLAGLRARFESNRLDGPYFPLARFGDFYATVRNKEGAVVSFSRFESAREQRKFAEDMKAEGRDVETGVLKEMQARDAVDPGFVADVEGLLEDIDADEMVMDAIWQRWLQTLPDMSMRKSKLHRKAPQGYSGDAFRAFGSQMFHGAHQLARLTYSLDMGEALDAAEQEARHSDSPERNGLIVKEVARRHEYVMNPQGSAWAQTITGAAFVYYLSMTPAAALVNLTQTVIVGTPILGAYHGKGGQATAAKELLRASQDFARGKAHAVDSKRLTKDEKRAMNDAYERGTIDKSQSHDLAGVGETGVEYSPVRTKVMGIISWMFHHTERANREVTFLAAYRMAKAKGLQHEKAVEKAADLTWRTHFDYQNTSRPRLLQNDYLRVAMVFRNFQINMLWRLFRDTHQALNGESSAVKAEARRQLIGISAQMLLNAGVKGVWGYSLLKAFAGMFFAGGGDEAEKELEKLLMSVLPRDVAGAFLNGVPGHMLGIDLRSRVGMPDLWFRAPDRQLEGEDEYNYWVQQLLGAGPGIAQNVHRGVQQIGEGHVWRGVETIMPKAIRDIMRSGRYWYEGAQTYNGDPIIDEFKPQELIAQVIGFTPARLSERYDANSRLKNEERKILDEKKSIMRDASDAARAGRGIPESVLADIAKFNEENPEVAITNKSLSRSIKGRMQASERNEFGVILNPRLNEKLRGDAAPLVYD